MSDKITVGDPPCLGWRARAHLRGGTWTDAAYGFGGPDVAEVVGGPETVGAALACFLNSLERLSVEAERHGSGHFSVRLEVEPHEGQGGREGPSALATSQGDTADEPVPLWEASAAVGNARGVFDAAYAFGNSKGDEGHLVGTAQELGAELARVLQDLTRADVEAMKYGTPRFFLEVLIEPPKRK